MIDKKLKCTHCNDVIKYDPKDIHNYMCSCGKLVIRSAVITEGIHGVDYIDVSSVLLNE